MVWNSSGTRSRALGDNPQALFEMLHWGPFAANRWGMAEVKICGLTTVDDALRCVDAGADAIGLNFWPRSPRRTDVSGAKAIVEAVGDRVQTVGVFVDFTVAQIREILAETGIGWAQLHGDETPEQVAALLPAAYKALGVKDGSVVERARSYPGEHLLLDASVPGLPGGTGQTFDWAIASEVALERKLTLAGGLNPRNVAEAIEAANPFCVDVASGVESEPGRKDAELVRAFIEAAKAAFFSA